MPPVPPAPHFPAACPCAYLLLNQADGERGLARSEARLALEANARAAAAAQDKDLVKVEGAVAANASGIHHLRHLGAGEVR